MEINSFSLSPGICWHLHFGQLRFKLDSSIGDRNPEACVDPEDKGDCFNYFPGMAYPALTSAWSKVLGAWCMQPCNYAFKFIFLINLNMLEKLTGLESTFSWPGHWIESRLLKWDSWSQLPCTLESSLVEVIKCLKFQILEIWSDFCLFC